MGSRMLPIKKEMLGFTVQPLLDLLFFPLPSLSLSTTVCEIFPRGPYDFKDKLCRLAADEPAAATLPSQLASNTNRVGLRR